MSLMSMFPGGGGTNNQPLKAPTNLYAVMNSSSSIQITWTDPENEYSQPSGTLIGEWMFTRIVRKIGSAPVNANDGEMIVESAVKNQYQTTGFIDSNNIVLGTEYYYAAFAFTKSRVSSPGAVFNVIASYYDPVLENNSWSAIYNACVEGVASSIWSKGDTKTDNGETYSILAFNPTIYSLTDGGRPYILFDLLYWGEQDTAYASGDGVERYGDSTLKNVIDSYYNKMSTELKQYVEKVDAKIYSRKGEYNEELETYSLYTFPSGAFTENLYPTASLRAAKKRPGSLRSDYWWTGNTTGMNDYKNEAEAVSGDYGSIANGISQSMSVYNPVPIFAFGKVGE